MTGCAASPWERTHKAEVGRAARFHTWVNEAPPPPGGGGHDEFLMRGSDFGGGEGVRKDQNGLVWLIFVFRVICHLSLCWYFVFLGLFYEFHEL